MQTVIVVDDEPGITLTLSLLLRRKGYEVYTANSGPAALRLTAVFCPDFLLTDIVMPGMSGLELIEHIRQACPSTRIILFTGKPDSIPDDRLPVQKVFFKPVNPSELLNCLQAA